MPTYEYQCDTCGAKFDRRQSITEPPLTQCPSCSGHVRRLVSGGAGFVIKGSGDAGRDAGKNTCSLEQTGRTCCGRTARCEKPDCGGDV